MHELTEEERKALLSHICNHIVSMDYWATANAPDIDETAEKAAGLFKGILAKLVGAEEAHSVLKAYIEKVGL